MADMKKRCLPQRITGIDCIVIKRPVEENGVSLPELIKYLKTKGL